MKLTICRDETVSPEDISFVIFPCSTFEMSALLKQVRNLNFCAFEPIEGNFIQVGELFDSKGSKLPIAINIQVWKINYKWVAFVEPISDMFSYQVINNWLRTNGFVKEWDNYTRPTICNPINFHLALAAIS